MGEMGHQPERERILLPGEEFIQCRLKERLLGDGGGEERHRGAELEVVGVAHDRLDLAARRVEHEPDALLQARPEDGMLEIIARLRFRGEAVPLARLASPEGRQLREDEPDPVRLFPAGRQLAPDRAIDRILSRDESGEAVGFHQSQCSGRAQ